jgi:hypothetical protein
VQTGVSAYRLRAFILHFTLPGVSALAVTSTLAELYFFALIMREKQMAAAGGESRSLPLTMMNTRINVAR